MIELKKAFRLLVLLALMMPFASLSAWSQSADAPTLEQLHQELRDLKQTAVDAINKGSKDALLDALSPRVIITAFNNDNVRGIDAVKEYYARMMVGADRIIQEMSITAEADDLSELYADNTMAVVSGTSKAHFKIKAGPTFDIPLRWSAVADRSSGKWKFAAMHFSSKPVDNPLVSALVSIWKWAAGILAIIGLALGYFLGRRKARTA